MRKNNLKIIWAKGDVAINGWLHIPSSWSAEVMAHQGFDSLTVDLQHGLVDYQAAVPMFQAISTTDVVPLARVPWLEPAIIMKLLDAGAYGIICPMINTREECEAFIGACRYHPDGYRSLGPTRARLYGGADYSDHANDEVLTIAMVETAQAIDNLEEIVSTPGLDAVYIGPGDLSLTLGMKSRVDNTEPKFLEILETIISTCRRYDVIVSIYTSDPSYARDMINRGLQFITVMADSYLLGNMANQVVTAVREGNA